MTKQELVAAMAEGAGISNKEAAAALEALATAIHSAVAKGNEVTVPKLGKFTRKQREARTGRNPKTGEAMEIPAGTAPAFRPSKDFREAVG